jgi:hypothetical protein
VIFGDPRRAKAALAKAAAHARGLDLQIEVLTAQVVPFPLPLSEPPVSVEFAERAVSQLVAGVDAAVSVHILLCRDSNEALRKAVPRESLVVIAGDNLRLARLLAADGHRLIVIH